MARVTGVAVSESSVRIVELEGSPRKYRITRFGAGPIVYGVGANRTEEIAAAVKYAFKASRAGRDQVALGIPSHECVVREIPMPFVDEQQIGKVIKFESESHLHSCAIEDVIVAWAKVAEQGAKSRVLVLAARKEMLRDHLAALGQCAVDPLVVDVDAAALFAVAETLPEVAEHDCYAVIDIGEATSTLILAAGHRLRMVRSVRIGEETVTSAIQRDLDIDQDMARLRTREFATRAVGATDELFTTSAAVLPDKPEEAKSAAELEQDIIGQRFRDFCGKVDKELRRSISSSKIETPLTAIFVTGPGSRLGDLQNMLGARFGVPVRTLDVLSHVDHRFDDDGLAEANLLVPVAVGLGLKLLGHDPLRLDFRQEEYRFTQKFEKIKLALTCTALFLAILAAYALLHVTSVVRAERNRIAWVVNEGRNQFESMTRLAGIVSAGEQRRSADDIAAWKKAGKIDPDRERRWRDLVNPKAGVEPSARLNGMQREMADLRDDLEKRFGITRPSDSDDPADKNLEQRFGLALANWNAFFRELDGRREAIGRFTLERLRITVDLVEFDITLEDYRRWDALLEAMHAASPLGKDSGVTYTPPVATGDNRTLYKNVKFLFREDR